MLKHILLAGGMMIAGPALAQTQAGATQTQAPQGSTTAQGTSGRTTPAPTASTAPTGDAMTSQSSPADPAPTASNGTAVGDATVEPGTAPSQTMPTPQPTPTPAPQTQTAAAGGTQVEQIVGREFGAYDKDADGKLSQVEFDAWMVALKTASDPTTNAAAPATKQWLGAAFAQADKDKSRDLTKAELTGFLSQGQS